jgi:hypothetical protein
MPNTRGNISVKYIYLQTKWWEKKIAGVLIIFTTRW